MIVFQDVRFRYPGSDAFALDVPELRIGEGEKIALVGPSGSGKTTIVSLIAGILSPERGSIVVDDVALERADDSARRVFRLRRIGLVFQEFELLEYLSATENILLPYFLDGTMLLEDKTWVAVRELAARCGLSDKLDRLPAELSQGERQRVAICRALVMKPKLLIADEPTANLDSVNAATAMDILIEFSRRDKITCIVITHDKQLLPAFDRVIDVSRFSGLRGAP
ncbi:MAG: ABC transporter ATP-binding protein [Candidatus Riflebacteria bacterium]|nr:ABC transporter ATP-binding protein [Candidatus Riflebacteria bacterium]